MYTKVQCTKHNRNLRTFLVVAGARVVAIGVGITAIPHPNNSNRKQGACDVCERMLIRMYRAEIRRGSLLFVNISSSKWLEKI